MSDLSKLADEIIFLDNEEKKTIQFDFAGDLDTDESLNSADVTFSTESGITISAAAASENIAQCTITTTTSETVGLYTLKCIAGVSGSAHKYVGRGRVRVQ